MGFSKKNSVNSPLLRIMEFQWVVRILMEFQGVKGKNIGKFQRVVKVLMEFQGDGRKKKNTRKFQGVKQKKQLQKTPGRWWRFWWDSRRTQFLKKEILNSTDYLSLDYFFVIVFLVSRKDFIFWSIKTLFFSIALWCL